MVIVLYMPSLHRYIDISLANYYVQSLDKCYEQENQIIVFQYNRLTGNNLSAKQLREKCIARMVTDWAGGLLLDDIFEPDPPTYFKANRIPGTFTDHVFLTYCTILLGHDLVIIHMTPRTVANRMFSWIQGKYCLFREMFLFYEHELIQNYEPQGLSLSYASLVLFVYRRWSVPADRGSINQDTLLPWVL